MIELSLSFIQYMRGKGLKEEQGGGKKRDI